MISTYKFNNKTPKLFLKTLMWVFVIVITLRFIFKTVLDYYDIKPEIYGPYWPVKYWMVVHISASMVAILVGPFQFWSFLRKKYLNIHRWLGRIYLIGILIGTVCAIPVVIYSSFPINWGWGIATATLTLFWFVTTAMAYRVVRLGRIQQHKEWMIRSFVMTVSVLLFRLIMEIPIMRESVTIGLKTGVSFLSWTVPLLFTELILQWNKK